MAGRRGPKISPEVQRLIREQALLSPKKRTELAVELETMIEAKGWSSPTIETMEKLISKMRNQRDSQDAPWSVTTLAEYENEIPPESLPTVLKVWQKTLEWNWIKPLSIREAKWVARLSYTIKDLETLCCLAVENAVMEEIIRDAGSIPVDPLFDAQLYSSMTGLDIKWKDGEFEWFVAGHKKPAEGYDMLRDRANLQPAKVKRQRKVSGKGKGGKP